MLKPRTLLLYLLLPALFAATFGAQGASFPFRESDYGPFLSHSFDNADGKNTLNGTGGCANKGIAIKIAGTDATVIFDTDLCRMAAGWTGGWLDLKGTVFDGKHGPNPKPAAEAAIVFETNPNPGWSKGTEFADPRKLPEGPGAATVHFGPLPNDWAKYRGLYVSGDQVVLAYMVGTAQLLELPALEKSGAFSFITRTFNVFGKGAAASVLAAEGPQGSVAEVNGGVAVLAPDAKKPEMRLIVALIGEGKVEVSGPRISVALPEFAADQTAKVVYWRGAESEVPAATEAIKALAKPADLRPLTKGGSARWKDAISVTGTVATEEEAAKSAYVVDTIPVPFENPFKSWMRTAAFDFFKDGTTAAVSTWNGDVWLVSGVDDKLDKVVWKRFAGGLFHALGIRIVDEQVYVLGRDQITRLHDLNRDGEADLYECFNNDVQVTPAFHEFTFGLETDAQGNFYFSKGGPVNPGGRGFGPLCDHHGCILKVSKDGSKLEVYATGVRAPNGISVSPEGQVTTGDNEGSWVPKCYVHLVKPGEAVTVSELAHTGAAMTDYSRHVCFMPKDVDNSGGGQIWVTSDKWGMNKGRLLHLSYGTCSLLPVLMEEVDGVPQGGVYRMPLKFGSGVMRGRFNPRDGQLYLAGLKGWQSSAAQDGCFHRVRYTGQAACVPEGIKVTPKGIQITFSTPLSEEEAKDPESYSVEQWNYKWSSAYGSDDWKVSDPKSKGRDVVELKSVALSEDKKTVTLEYEDVQPVMQMRIKMNLKGANGSPVPKEIVNTINVVPKA